MKKLLIVLSVLFLMSGCEANTTDTLSCSSTTVTNGVTTKTTYDIDYMNDDVKYVTITYDYSQDNVSNNTSDDNNTMDGLNADTDGISEDDSNDNNQALESDDVVDGVVGDVIDGTVNGVTETILDLAGIKNRYENQLTTYDNIEGFSYRVDVNSDTEYKVIYEIDMDKISDDDLTRFNVTRDFSDIQDDYEGSGYTCQ